MFSRPSVATKHVIALLAMVATISLHARGEDSGKPVWYVNLKASPPGNGLSWSTAFTDLQSALSAATSGEEIWVAGVIPQGITPDFMDGYKPAPPGGPRSASFVLKNGVEIYGSFGGFESSRSERQLGVYWSILHGDLNGDDDLGLQGDNSYHVVRASSIDDTAILDGFFIVSGRATGSGIDEDGGGFHCVSSSPILRNCYFGWNQAFGSGGAVWMEESRPRIENCFFGSNAATEAAGAMQVHDGSRPDLYNCTFWSNHHDGINGEAGGIYIGPPASARIVNCTFSLNSSTQHYSAIFIHPFNKEETLIANSIIWDNQEDAGLTPVGGGGILRVTYSNTRPALPGDGNINQDPLFFDVNKARLQLRPSSPCIDAAHSCYYLGPYSDATGFLGRFVDDPSTSNTGLGDLRNLDMGSYEFPGDSRRRNLPIR